MIYGKGISGKVEYKHEARSAQCCSVWPLPPQWAINKKEEQIDNKVL